MSEDPASDGESVAQLIASADSGDVSAAAALFTALYRELHTLARRQLARGGARLTLGATTLLHEAYLVLAGREKAVFPDRARFMGYAARVMRGLLIDHVRSRTAQKRGGQFEITSYEVGMEASTPDVTQLAHISDALDALATVDPELAQLVDLRFFCGLSLAEIGALRAQSTRTVQRHWEKARLYLHSQLSEAEEARLDG